jgi:hypothetical protein
MRLGIGIQRRHAIIHVDVAIAVGVEFAVTARS